MLLTNPRVQVYKCHDCGAAAGVPEGTDAPPVTRICGYCGGTMTQEQATQQPTPHALIRAVMFGESEKCTP